jgi:hypothetical protein
MTCHLFDPGQRRAAARIAQHSAQWIIIWGTATCEYWPFPCSRSPPGPSPTTATPPG